MLRTLDRALDGFCTEVLQIRTFLVKFKANGEVKKDNLVFAYF